MYSSKLSQEYILLSNFKLKTPFSAIFRGKNWAKPDVSVPFWYIPGGMEGLFVDMNIT